MPPLLAATSLRRDLTQGALDLPLLRGASLTVEPGERIALIGASGSGKSALLRHLAGLDFPDSGTVHWDNIDVAALAPPARHALRRTTLGYVRPEGRAAPGLAAREDCDLLGPFGMAAFESLLDGDHPPASGLSRRRALARALANKPKALLVDDPTRGLEADDANNLAHTLLALVIDRGIALVVASQHPTLIGGVHRVVQLVRGRVQ